MLAVIAVLLAPMLLADAAPPSPKARRDPCPLYPRSTIFSQSPDARELAVIIDELATVNDQLCYVTQAVYDLTEAVRELRRQRE